MVSKEHGRNGDSKLSPGIISPLTHKFNRARPADNRGPHRICPNDPYMAGTTKMSQISFRRIQSTVLIISNLRISRTITLRVHHYFRHGLRHHQVTLRNLIVALLPTAGGHGHFTHFTSRIRQTFNTKRVERSRRQHQFCTTLMGTRMNNRVSFPHIQILRTARQVSVDLRPPRALPVGTSRQFSTRLTLHNRRLVDHNRLLNIISNRHEGTQRSDTLNLNNRATLIVSTFRNISERTADRRLRADYRRALAHHFVSTTIVSNSSRLSPILGHNNSRPFGTFFTIRQLLGASVNLANSFEAVPAIQDGGLRIHQRYFTHTSRGVTLTKLAFRGPSRVSTPR